MSACLNLTRIDWPTLVIREGGFFFALVILMESVKEGGARNIRVGH